MNDLLKLGLIAFSGLFTVTLSTRSVTRQNYFQGVITSVVAGSFYWLTLKVALPKLDSILAGVVYVGASTIGRILAMWVCINFIERGKIRWLGNKVL